MRFVVFIMLLLMLLGGCALGGLKETGQSKVTVSAECKTSSECGTETSCVQGRCVSQVPPKVSGVAGDLGSTVAAALVVSGTNLIDVGAAALEVDGGRIELVITGAFASSLGLAFTDLTEKAIAGDLVEAVLVLTNAAGDSRTALRFARGPGGSVGAVGSTGLNGPLLDGPAGPSGAGGATGATGSTGVTNPADSGAALRTRAHDGGYNAPTLDGIDSLLFVQDGAETQQLPAQAALPVSGATSTSDGLILLPEASTTAGFRFTFSVPDDYRPSTAISIRLTLSASPASTCNMRILADDATRFRAGLDKVSVTMSPVSLAFSLFPASSDTIRELGFSIPFGAGTTPGDVYAFLLHRNGSDVNDTCTVDLTLVGIRTIYTRDEL
ncbi:MAG: hypothetical protein IT381_33585 [Deltaproteobacteria bacterium]|nr:hypothetical protein [Deltaproteobacteria bacterium]